jgi:hypothetical protein
MNDKLCKLILEDLNKRHESGKTKRKLGIFKSRKIKIDGYNQAEINSNFDYLLQTGYIKKEKFNSSDFFRISDRGINHLRGPSMFQKSNRAQGINIKNVNGIVIIGNNNLVRQSFSELYENLEKLLIEIKNSLKISDEDKINYQAEIETIKDQLAKKDPTKKILQNAWNGLAALATIEGLVQFYDQVKNLILPIIKQ